MEAIQILDKRFIKALDEHTIQDRVANLGYEMSIAYSGQEVVFIVVLNGASFFAVDVLKNFRGDAQISFVKYSSYDGMKSSGEVRELMGLDVNVRGKQVVIIEDIVETGLTISSIKNLLEREEADEVKICSLLYKPSENTSELEPNWVGFEISKEFVVGYGLDYNGKGRHYPSIYKLKEA